jgi:Flp pilus assembly protein TadG
MEEPMTCPRRRGPDEGGASVVEFALLAPLFIMILFAIISFGLVFAQQLGLSNGARQGARGGVVKGATCAQIYTAAQDAAGTIGMSGSSVTVTITRGQTAASASSVCGATPASSSTQPCLGSAAGDSLYVKTSYSGQIIVPPVYFKSNVPLSSTGAYECEFSS